MPKALIVLTGSSVWTMKDGTRHPTGFWAREFLEAYDAFKSGGLEVDLATPLGVTPTVDELSWYPPQQQQRRQLHRTTEEGDRGARTAAECPLEARGHHPPKL